MPNTLRYPTDAEAKKLIVEIGKRMYAKNFVAANDGNISCKVADDIIWATPTGVSKGFMSKAARKMNTTIFVKNAPSYSGLGFGGEGFTTMTIATPTGEGVTSARTFTRLRRCVLYGDFRIS